MEDLTKAITTEIVRWPEGTPITAAAILHPGNRPAVSRALRTLAKHAEILRVTHGVYVAAVRSRFGRHSPGVQGFIQQLATHSGDAGELIRVLAWAGPAEASKVLRQNEEKVPKAAVTKVQQHAAVFPPWLWDALHRS